MHYEFVLAGQESMLSDEEFALSRNIQRCVQELVESRDEYISSRSLDAALFVPSGNWEVCCETHLLRGYRQLIVAGPETISGLRRLSSMYTGFYWELSGHREACDSRNLNEQVVLPDERPDEGEDFYLYRYIDSLERVPKFLRMPVPVKFGEMGWMVDGRLVTHDSFVYLERLALMHEIGLFAERDRALDIIEIGAGYGGLAYYLKQLFPRANYYVIDLPESLLFSSIYLSVLYKSLENRVVLPTDGLSAYSERDFSFVANYLFPQLIESGMQFDLAINMLSLTEMTQAQVELYCAGIARLLKPAGVFFEQNQSNPEWVTTEMLHSLCAKYFSRRTALHGCFTGGLTQGLANVWSI